MENYTYNSFTLQMEGLKITKETMYPVFFLYLTSYIVIMVMNIGISILIVIDKNLHQPMYLLLCSLSVSDIIGSTNIMPRLLSDILRPPSERLISYYECVLQGFTTQLFGTTSHTVLMIMAFDRYVAICNPLRYAAIMTNKMVVKLTVSAWGVAFVLVGILLGLTIRLNRCRTVIMNPCCDNASLFKLSCESVFINNIYGLTFTVVLLSSSIGSIVLTYAKITVVCVTSKSKSLNSKALKTCSTHLMSYMIMLCSGFIVVIALMRDTLDFSSPTYALTVALLTPKLQPYLRLNRSPTSPKLQPYLRLNRSPTYALTLVLPTPILQLYLRLNPLPMPILQPYLGLNRSLTYA
ncbi:olfactory receptor 8G17-like [Limanda limanda]|uniref:olfactory receptor 8G17-like n=1 Tax=Limanda limanda TaxID=27771 RepID=UPI0029C65813|nr:olfactory receptor 8G17-like [Limanda limanda]